MSALEDETIGYYQNLGYGYSQAVALSNADIARQRRQKEEADSAAAAAQRAGEAANQSFISNLTQKLTDLITTSQAQTAEQTNKSVQAVVDATASLISQKNFSTPDQTQPGQTQTPKAGKPGLWIVALAGLVVLLLWRRR